MVLRIDNVFFNTPDVPKLAGFYSSATGYPVRRTQHEGSGVMWAEISVGGMELSFRRANDTAEIHPHLKGRFLELAPGAGATISFEVASTDKERTRIERLGAKFFGDPIMCNGGQEVISIFADPAGRPVQLYEPRFKGPADVVAAVRASTMVPSGFSQRPTLVGSNLRGISGLAYSVMFTDADLGITREFYSALLEADPTSQSIDRAAWDVDGAVIEVRSTDLQDSMTALNGSRRAGVTPVFEVRSLGRAVAALMPSIAKPAIMVGEKLARVGGNRAIFADPEGNGFELWERSTVH